jgi:hypothetical protein
LLRDGAQKVLIGGTSSGATNVIVGCSEAAIQLTSSDGNVMQRNFIGVDASGTQPLGNLNGIIVYASNGNLIGGAALGAGNVISGNTRDGVLIMNEEGQLGAANNIVQGNYVGLGADGATALGNGVGVRISGASNNIVGLAAGDAGAGNIIAFNRDAAILEVGDEKTRPEGNSLRGNNIRTRRG